MNDDHGEWPQDGLLMVGFGWFLTTAADISNQEQVLNGIVRLSFSISNGTTFSGVPVFEDKDLAERFNMELNRRGVIARPITPTNKANAEELLEWLLNCEDEWLVFSPEKNRVRPVAIESALRDLRESWESNDQGPMEN